MKFGKRTEFRQTSWDEPEIFDLNETGVQRVGFLTVEDNEVLEREASLMQILGDKYRPPDELGLPQNSEVEVVRHFTRLSQEAYGVDEGPVPLGSCTMKYNPRIAWRVITRSGLAGVHPSSIELGVEQGLLSMLYELQEWFKSITGMDECSLQPPAGASGELAGILMIKEYHKDRGEEREYILVPDSAHGTNPASAAMGRFKVVRIPTGPDGTVDIGSLKAVLDESVAGMMMTNPNTLGLFEHKVLEITKLVHDAGGLLYYDGANLNGILGLARPGDMGFDIVHLNIHKTFSAPHGSGGPGAGVVCAKGELSRYLPGYIVEESRGEFILTRRDRSVGDMQSFYANFPQMVYAYTFILSYGKQGIADVGLNSILATNYFIKKIKGLKGVSIPFSPETPRFHEVVISLKGLVSETGVSAEDVAKYLLDKGVHAPTVYFPLIVEEALMIEFTETETLENVKYYAESLREAIEKAYENPEELKQSPRNTSVTRLDYVRANHPSTLTPSRKYEIMRERRRSSDAA